MTTATQYAASRFHTNPDSDEHAAMCWIRKAPFATEAEAREALLDLMLEEIDRPGMKEAVKAIALGADQADSGKIRWTIKSY